MSTEHPGDDPFRKKPQPGEPQQGEPQRGEPPYGEPRPGQPPPPPPPPGYSGQGRAGGATPHESPYGSPYGRPFDDPYGGPAAASDPLAGMPPLGSRGKRLLARIIDALIIGIPVAVITGLIAGFDSYDDTGAQYWQGAAYTLAYFVYEGLMLSRSGQTVGKKLMSIRVAMLQNGAAPSGAPAWVRALIYQIPALVPCLGTLFWLVNVLFCTWDKPYQQCLHDKGAKTVVVRAD